MASRGKSLSEIINMLTEVHKNMSTLGISAKSCSLPGNFLSVLCNLSMCVNFLNML